MKIGVYIPTLGRPGALAGVIKNLAASAPRRLYALTFIVEPFDKASLKECKRLRADVIVNPYEATYSNAIQAAFEQRPTEFFLNGNDDFDFRPGWAEAVLAHFIDPSVMVVGVDDGFPFRGVATIHVVRRTYIEEVGGVIDMPPGRVYFPYEHNYIDPEFWATAERRGVTDWALEAQVRHVHGPSLGLSYDATYEKGQESALRDGALYASRQHLWSAS